MVHKNADMEHTVRENIRGGVGRIETDVVYKAEEMLGKATLFNRLHLTPGSSIGEHPHNEDAEIYYVVEGQVVVTDNDKEIVMEAGDAMFTGGGDRHSLMNKSDKEAIVLAIVIA